jgi:hypothetical protein
MNAPWPWSEPKQQNTGGCSKSGRRFISQERKPKAVKTVKMFLSGVVLLLASTLAMAQASLTSTTLSSAVNDTSQNFVVVGSASGISAGNTGGFLLVDGELMDVTAVNGTVINVVRGANGTRAVKHASGATVLVGNPEYFTSYPRFGACTSTDETVLPWNDINPKDGPFYGAQFDCFNGSWAVDLTNLALYKLTIAPGAQRSATSPAAGAAISMTSQGGGAQSATTSNGAAGGANSSIGGVGGAGGSSSGTGGAGGAVNVVGGAGGGTVTGGVGGLATVGGGAGGNGTSAGGTGGGLNIYSGAAGTGGTGTNGAVNIRQGGAAGTAAFSVSTAGLTTIASTVSGQNVAITPVGAGVVAITNNGVALTLNNTTAGSVANVYSCGATGVNQSCSPAAADGKAQIFNGQSTLSSNAATITFPSAFTSTTSYFCVANDVTTRANPVQMIPASGTTATITNTTGGSDVIQWICIGH